jgi:hypothetical protein
MDRVTLSQDDRDAMEAAEGQKPRRQGVQAKVEEVLIDDILVLEQTVWARTKYNEEALKDYRAHCDDLPPVRIRRVQVDVNEKTWADWPEAAMVDAYLADHSPKDRLLILSNGFHTTKARQMEARTHVNAIIVDGTLEQAIADSIKLNNKHGVRFTAAEKTIAALRLHALFPKLSARKLADLVGCSHWTVEDALKIDAVQTALKGGGRYLPFLTRSHLRALGRAREETWLEWADRALAEKWSAQALEQHIKASPTPPTPIEPERPEPEEHMATPEPQEAPVSGFAAAAEMVARGAPLDTIIVPKPDEEAEPTVITSASPEESVTTLPAPLAAEDPASGSPWSPPGDHAAGQQNMLAACREDLRAMHEALVRLIDKHDYLVALGTREDRERVAQIAVTMMQLARDMEERMDAPEVRVAGGQAG